MATLEIVIAVFCGGAVITVIGTWLIERAYLPRGRFIEVGGFRQHVIELGTGSGQRAAPTIVLLHGAGANLEDMNVALGALLAAQYRIVLVDRPGCGFSERKTREGGSPAYQAEILGQLLERLGIERPILVGHSWGATMAITFALNYPEQVAGLVLIAPPTHPRMQYMTWLNVPLAGPVGWIFAYTLALPLGALLIAIGIRGAFLPQKPPVHYISRSAALLALRPKALLANWTDVGHFDAFLKRQVARYGALVAPTIALAGDRDPLAPPQYHAMKLAEVAPTVTLHVLHGFGHMLHHAAADRVAAAIEEVVSK
jgi:pimeloyl-ACP methyl ester carboxylesterase